MFANRPYLFPTVLLLVLLPLAAVALAIGPVPLTPGEVWLGLTGGGRAMEAVIVQDIRLPRVVMAMLAGSALGIGGAAMQGFLRNPLADPALLGVTNGAAFGAIIAIYGGFSATAFILPAWAMLGAIFAVYITCELAGKGASSATLLLAGIAVSSLAGAACAVALNLAPNPFAAMDALFWLMGSLEGRSLKDVVTVLPFIVAGFCFLLSCRRGLDALSLGEDTAVSLGFSRQKLQFRLTAGIALAIGAVTAVSGSIGFVGLVVPHVLRPLVGSEPSRLLPVSALGGAILVLAADMLVRLVPVTGMELRLGVVTSLVGAPFFLWLLLRRRGQTGL